MHVRLAFSVAIQVDADVLLIDEVLAVGDAAFQQKCFDVFNEMRDSGKTIIFVTHDMGSMQRFCHRALLLERGSPVYMGDPHEVADRYLELNFGRDPEAEERAGKGTQWRRGGARHRGVGGRRAGRARDRGPAAAADHPVRPGRVLVDVEDPAASCMCSTRSTRPSSSRTRRSRSSGRGQFRAGDEVGFSFTFQNVLAPGRYSPMFTLAHRGSGLDVIDRFEGSFSFVVTGPYAQGGVVDLPVQSTVNRSVAPRADETQV